MKSAFAQAADAHTHGTIAAHVTKVAGAVTTYFGFTVNEWGVIVGIVLGILSYVTQLYYKRQEMKLKKRYYDSKIESPE